MRVIVRSLPGRLTAGVIAGAALLSGAAIQQARAQSHPTGLSGPEEISLALPNFAIGGSGGARLPFPLSPSDAARIRKIFAWQREGEFADAVRASLDLASPLLNGHILADRMLRRPDAATLAELTDWLRTHPALPDEGAIRALVTARAPAAKLPVPPVPLPAIDADAPEDGEPDLPGITRRPALEAGVLDRLRTQRPEAALSLIEAARGLEPLYAAVLRAQVARQMLAFAEDRPQVERTRALAEQAFALSDGRAGEAGFVTGLALWRLGDADTARPFFEAASVAAYASPALRSAGAFWAARAHLRSRQAALYAPWMNRAADEGRSFHGLLARRIMGRGLGFATVRDILSEADTAAMAALPGGARAFGLLQVGEIGRAEAELRALYPLARQQKPLLRALYLSARDAGLDGLAADLAGPVQALDGLARDDIRYPMPRLSPHGGFRLDQALIYGLARVESNFDPAAISPVGARGLLQIMPRTASYLAGDPRAQDFSDASEVALAEHAQRLHEPALNLKIGQDYLLYLARLPAVGGNLVKLLAVYNAGPNALLRVPGTGSADLVGQDDPLLFIELIPSATTRRFVARVLSASWIYAAKLRVPAPGLDTLASGGWPTLPEARKMETARLH